MDCLHVGDAGMWNLRKNKTKVEEETMSLIRRKPAAELAPWNAFRELEDQLTRVFGEPLVNTDDWSNLRQNWAPAVDITESDDAFLVTADLPGVPKENINIEVLDNVITISGERTSEVEKDEKGAHRIERTYGSFRRSLTIPTAVDSENVSAKFKDGVLEVTLPKSEAAKPRLINVEAN